MSRRYGRNQRRRAREALAASQPEVTTTRARLEDTRHRAEHLADELDHARAVAGDGSIFFEPTTMEVPGEAREMFQTYPRERCELPALQAEEMRTLRLIPMHVLLARIDEDRLNRMVHAYVRFSDARAAYSISEDALQRLDARGLEHLLHQGIARTLSRELVKQLRPRRPGGRR